MTTVAFHADQVFARVPGGIGAYVRRLVPALAASPAPPEITLFHAAFDAVEPAEEWMGAFPRHRLPWSIRLLYPGWDLVGRPALPPALADLDILHAPSPAAVPPPGPRQRLVVTVHDLAFRRYPALLPPPWLALFRLGTRRAARRADAILVPSRSTARDLVSLEGADGRRVHVTPLAPASPPGTGDPGPVLARLGIPLPYVLFAGTLEPRKNLPRLVRAYRRAVVEARLPHTLVLAGPAGWRSRRLAEEARRSWPGLVILTGPVPGPDLDALYRGADLFVYPSLYEGFGLPVLEAMARGVPCVVARTSSLPEVAGDAALAVDPRSEDDLAAAIARLLTDRAEAGRLAEAGRARSEAFSWERTAERTLEVYASLLN